MSRSLAEASFAGTGLPSCPSTSPKRISSLRAVSIQSFPVSIHILCLSNRTPCLLNHIPCLHIHIPCLFNHFPYICDHMFGFEPPPAPPWYRHPGRKLPPGERTFIHWNQDCYQCKVCPRAIIPFSPVDESLSDESSSYIPFKCR